MLSSGRKVYPARIEGLLRFEPLVSNVLLAGDGKSHVSALIAVDAEAAARLGRAVLDAEVRRAVARVNQQLAPFERA